jgi:hypothetical protein
MVVTLVLYLLIQSLSGMKPIFSKSNNSFINMYLLPKRIIKLQWKIMMASYRRLLSQTSMKETGTLTVPLVNGIIQKCSSHWRVFITHQCRCILVLCRNWLRSIAEFSSLGRLSIVRKRKTIFYKCKTLWVVS